MLQPMGDEAILATFADEEGAMRWAAAVRAFDAPWLVDVVQAYTSVAVFFDLDQTGGAAVRAALADLPVPEAEQAPGRCHEIPCCYEFPLDLERIAAHTGLTTAEVLALHAGREYTVYAIGFCPGFPYLGYLPDELGGVPRLPSPRLRVEAGSVGLTGRQTGIYTEARPGGWHLVGRTPLVLVDVAAEYFPLRTGDRVRFAAITRAGFDRLEGTRL